MSIFTTDIVEYARLAHRVLCDEPPPDEIDAICFFGQTEENDMFALRAIAKRWQKHQCLVLVGTCERIERGGLIVRGSDAWVSTLEELGVHPGSILVYPMSDKLPPSTDAEALGMVEAIRENSWTRFVIVVPPLHAIRAFVSLVSACVKSGLDVAIWSAPATAPAWDEDVFHSGSMPSAPRVDQIAGEFGKIMAYCAKGDHLTAAEVLEWLRNHPGT